VKGPWAREKPLICIPLEKSHYNAPMEGRAGEATGAASEHGAGSRERGGGGGRKGELSGGKRVGDKRRIRKGGRRLRGLGWKGK